MPRIRTSLLCLAGAAAVALAASAGCSGADKAPNDTYTGGSGGTGGIDLDGGGSGGMHIDGGVVCTDPTDTDGDGIADQIEGKGDTDGDGTPDYKDLDSDGDGIPDKDEAANPSLPPGTPGRIRNNPCDPVADTDGDGTPDFQDLDSDGDGLPDSQEPTCKGVDCRVKTNCDDSPDGLPDVIEVAAKSDPCDGKAPPNGELYFIVPYGDPVQSKKFDFSAGVKDADIYFLIDTTQSMQAAIDNVKTSLDTSIIPKILNGDPTANPPMPAIPGAWIGIGTFRDVPWLPWGVNGDNIFSFFFDISGTQVYGNMSPPQNQSGNLVAPANVKQILGNLTASGGGDAPEGTTQALWMAAVNKPYRAYAGGGPWPPNPATGSYDATKWMAKCADSNNVGRACFRPGKLPVFVIITDAAFHNGPVTAFDYVEPPSSPPTGNPVMGDMKYKDVVDSLNSIQAKIVGVSVNTGAPGVARHDLEDLATKTNSFYGEEQFGQITKKPLVTAQDTADGNVSSEVVRLIGLLAGEGLKDVTTVHENYSCPGGVDCNGDGAVDPKYDNFIDKSTGKPFDATQMIKAVKPVAITPNPPYSSIDATTFYGVRGDATIQFEVFAQNTVLKTTTTTVVEVLLHVQTPGGQALGGKDGVKTIYLVIPPYIKTIN